MIIHSISYKRESSFQSNLHKLEEIIIRNIIPEELNVFFLGELIFDEYVMTKENIESSHVSIYRSSIQYRHNDRSWPPRRRAAPDRRATTRMRLCPFAGFPIDATVRLQVRAKSLPGGGIAQFTQRALFDLSDTFLCKRVLAPDFFE